MSKAASDMVPTGAGMKLQSTTTAMDFSGSMIKLVLKPTSPPPCATLFSPLYSPKNQLNPTDSLDPFIPIWAQGFQSTS